MSHRLALIPSDVRQTPVPLSSDRRSYYFLIALVARVSRDRLHRVTDSSVNTAGLKVTEWALTTAMPSSRLSSHLSPDICLSLSRDLGHPQPPHITFTWHTRSRVTCGGVRLFLTLFHHLHQRTKVPQPPKVMHLDICHLHLNSYTRSIFCSFSGELHQFIYCTVASQQCCRYCVDWHSFPVCQ